MRRVPLHIRLLALGLLCLNSVSCFNRSFDEVEINRAKLINNIESYQSIDDFEKYLKDTNFMWDGRGDRGVNVKDETSFFDRPPINMYTIAISNYSHLGYMGKLEVVFFNNRLFSTRFYVTNREEYLNKYTNTMNIMMNDDNTANVSRFSRLIIGTDHEGSKYIQWFDLRLKEELRIWVKENA